MDATARAPRGLVAALPALPGPASDKRGGPPGGVSNASQAVRLSRATGTGGLRASLPIMRSARSQSCKTLPPSGGGRRPPRANVRTFPNHPLAQLQEPEVLRAPPVQVRHGGVPKRPVQMARVRVGMEVVIGQRQIVGKPQPGLEDLEIFGQVLLEADEEQIVQPRHEVFLALEPLPVAVPDVGDTRHRGLRQRALLIVHRRQGGRQPIGCAEALKRVPFLLAPPSGISGFPPALPAVEAADESADGIAHEEEELLQPARLSARRHDDAGARRTRASPCRRSPSPVRDRWRA